MTTFRFLWDTTTVVSDLVEMNYTAGKQFLLDTISASNGMARFRITSSNTATIMGMKPGDEVTTEWSNGGSWSTFTYGNITDVSIEWGNPSTGGIYNDDYATVTFEGVLGLWGRQNTTLAVNAGTVTAQLTQVSSAGTGLAYTENFSTYNNPQMLATTISGSFQDYLQLLQSTTGCRYVDHQGSALEIDSAYNFPTSSYNFTDSTPSSSLMTYQASSWDSLSVNFYSTVIVSLGDNVIPVAATDPAATISRVLQMSTIWATPSEALGYAEYLLSLYEAPAIELSSVTCLTEAQNTQRLAQIAFTAIGRKFSIVHRGTTYYGICEGWSMTASPGTSQFTYYFSTGAQDVGWFILDSSTQGVLDVNKLGF